LGGGYQQQGSGVASPGPSLFVPSAQFGNWVARRSGRSRIDWRTKTISGYAYFSRNQRRLAIDVGGQIIGLRYGQSSDWRFSHNSRVVISQLPSPVNSGWWRVADLPRINTDKPGKCRHQTRTSPLEADPRQLGPTPRGGAGPRPVPEAVVSQGRDAIVPAASDEIFFADRKKPRRFCTKKEF